MHGVRRTAMRERVRAAQQRGTRASVATGLVSLPNRYMHSAVEVVSLSDLDNAAELLAAFLVALRGSPDFTP